MRPTRPTLAISEDRAGDGARLPRKEARRGDGRDRPEPQEQPAPGRADPDLKQRKPGPEQSAPAAILGPDITTSTLPRRAAGSVTPDTRALFQ